MRLLITLRVIQVLVSAFQNSKHFEGYIDYDVGQAVDKRLT